MPRGKGNSPCWPTICDVRRRTREPWSSTRGTGLSGRVSVGSPAEGVDGRHPRGNGCRGFTAGRVVGTGVDPDRRTPPQRWGATLPGRRPCAAPASPAPYPPEFRAEAIRLARSGERKLSEIAEDLGVSQQSLRNWVRQADLDDGRRHDGLTTDDRAEVARTSSREPGAARGTRNSSKEPPPSSPRRPARPREGVRVHRRGEGQP